MSIAVDEIREMSVTERLELLDDIWETLLEEPGLPHLSPAQLSEVDRRMELYRQHGDRGVSWEELARQLGTV